MPRKYVKRRGKPELFAKVFKVIHGLKDKKGLTVPRIAKEIHAKLEQMGLKPDSRNVLIQVRRALKFGVKNKLLLHRAGKYRLAVVAAKKRAVPLDSLELIKNRKTKSASRKSCEQKARRKNTSKKRSAPKRTKQATVKKCTVQPNKRYLSRKCKNNRYASSSSQSKSERSTNTESASERLAESLEDVACTKSMYNSANVEEFQEAPIPTYEEKISWEPKHNDNLLRKESCEKSKHHKPSRKSQMRNSPFHCSVVDPESQKRRRKKKKVSSLKEIENLTSDTAMTGLSTPTAIAAAIMIMMSLWYGYR